MVFVLLTLFWLHQLLVDVGLILDLDLTES
jgi:hypothetical protein